MRTPKTRTGRASTRITETLRSQIRTGSWRPGQKFPSEPDLAVELRASRGAVRAALTTLETEGLVIRKHGSGTFVSARQPLLNSLHVNHSSDQMITSTGRVAGTKFSAWQRKPADADVANHLGIEEGTEVLELHRVRTADDVPVTVSYDYLPASIIPSQPVLIGSSLYAFLSAVCGIEIEFGIARLIPSRADEQVSKELEVQHGSLCLTIRQVDHDTTGKPVSYSVEHHLAEAFDFELLRHGPSASRKRFESGLLNGPT
ncbi:GntR family transcriptional regulator [Rhizobium leguminosarum]|uniref:GntR family transcriptional regulator n=1 Tax=Rhizobium leguminosarum TaxID=384 RepID=UPI003F9510CC